MSWVKLKQDYVPELKLEGGGLGDTLDLVVMAGNRGYGRKRHWYSPLILGAWSAEKEAWEPVTGILSFTNEFYEEFKRWSEGEELGEPNLLAARPDYYAVPAKLECAAWFRPHWVLEVKGSELTLSPTYLAGQGVAKDKPEHGLSLRFPRLVKVREDKRPEDATTTEQLRQLYNMQSRRR
jgi:DNA ligase-1